MARKSTPKKSKSDTAKSTGAAEERQLRPTASADSGRPGGGQGREDATGVIRDKIRIDPEIMEGHRGYEETGPSEIVPGQRATKESS
jgi:hypothetical protein